MPQAARSPCWPQSKTGAGHDVPGYRRLLASPSTLEERSGTMRWMSGRARLATVALAVIAAVVAGGCGGGGAGGDKAGGAGEPVVLRMANAYGDLQTAPVVEQFVSQVKERSGGNLRVEVVKRLGRLRRRRRAAGRPGRGRGQGRPGLGGSAGLRHDGCHQLPGAAGADADRQLRPRAGRGRKRHARPDAAGPGQGRRAGPRGPRRWPAQADRRQAPHARRWRTGVGSPSAP